MASVENKMSYHKIILFRRIHSEGSQKHITSDTHIF